MTRVPLELTGLLALARASIQADGPRERQLLGTSQKDRFAAILREIDQTMQARSLRFKRSDGRSLVVEARARRAIRLSDANPVDDQIELLKSEMETPTSDRAEVAALLAGVFVRLSARPGDLSVLSSSSRLAPSVVDEGFDPDEIGRAVNASDFEPEDTGSDCGPDPVENEAGTMTNVQQTDTPDEAAEPNDEVQTPETSTFSRQLGQAISNAAQCLYAQSRDIAQTRVLADWEGQIIESEEHDEAFEASILARGLAAQAELSGPVLFDILAEPRLVCFSNGAKRSPALFYVSEKGEIAAVVGKRESLETVEAILGALSSPED